MMLTLQVPFALRTLERKVEQLNKERVCDSPGKAALVNRAYHEAVAELEFARQFFATDEHIPTVTLEFNKELGIATIKKVQ
jgi:hypothetical protein